MRFGLYVETASRQWRQRLVRFNRTGADRLAHAQRTCPFGWLAWCSGEVCVAAPSVVRKARVRSCSSIRRSGRQPPGSFWIGRSEDRHLVPREEALEPQHTLRKGARVMAVDKIPRDLRVAEKFHHIDPAFVNRRLCMTFLNGLDLLSQYRDWSSPELGHREVLMNDHLLITMVLDACEQSLGSPTLLGALEKNVPSHLFRSTERLEPCPEIYDAPRVQHQVELDIPPDKPVHVAYHTNHIVSDTGRMMLRSGARDNYQVSIVGMLHIKDQYYEIQPLVMGNPWFDHPRNGTSSERTLLMVCGYDFGEILPEDIDEFKKMSEVDVETEDEWMNAMKTLSESEVKTAFGKLLSEPTKKDWGGESDDHFSGSVTFGNRRRSAAFLLKGPSQFREMTLDMCGKRSDQIHRLVDSGADLSIVQHAHMVGPIVRKTLRNLTVYPGGGRRKYCIIDGKSTYRILKAYSLI